MKQQILKLVNQIKEDLNEIDIQLKRKNTYLS